MQNTKVQEFANKSGLLIPDTIKRRIVMPYLIGMAIANFLSVKVGTEVSANTAFADNHLINVGRVVSFLNEEMIIDVKTTCEAAKMMYIVRDRFINGVPASVAISPEFDLMAVALGLAPVMPVEIYTVMKETGLSANTVYAMATMLLMGLKEAGLVQL